MENKTFIPFPCYSYRIYIIFTDDLAKTAEKLVKEHHLGKNHGVDDTTDGFTIKMPNQSYTFIVLKIDANINQITHEAYHAVSNMFRWIGAQHEEEIFAYSMGYVVSLITQDQEKAKKALDKKKEL